MIGIHYSAASTDGASMTTTRTPHVSQRDAGTPENRRLQPGSADAPFFDKSGIVRGLVWANCLNISTSSFITIVLSGSAEAELVKNYMDLCTLLYQISAVLFFVAHTMPSLIPVKTRYYVLRCGAC